MKPLLSLLLNSYLFLCLACLQANAQLYFKNETTKPIWLSIAYNYVAPTANLAANTWITEGWLYLEPQQTRQVASHIGYDELRGTKSHFFYYAYQVEGKEWKGSRKFLLDARYPAHRDKLAFKIMDAHKAYLHRHQTTYQYGLFKLGIQMAAKPVTILLQE